MFSMNMHLRAKNNLYAQMLFYYVVNQYTKVSIAPRFRITINGAGAGTSFYTAYHYFVDIELNYLISGSHIGTELIVYSIQFTITNAR